VAVLFLTAFQFIIPQMPFKDPAITTTISAFTLYLVTALTVWKQNLSKQIDDVAKWPTIIVGITASVAGMADLLGVLPFTELADQWIRFGITSIVMFLNILSKVLWPTPQTHSII